MLYTIFFLQRWRHGDGEGLVNDDGRVVDNGRDVVKDGKDTTIVKINE